MTAAKKRGYDGNVYRNTGSHASKVWNQVAGAMDIKVNDTATTFNASDRASAVEKELPATYKWGIEFKMLVDLSDADFLALRTAYRAGTAIDLWFADGPEDTVGVSGPNAEWLITEFGADAPLTDGMSVSVKCVPHGNCSFEPEYLVIN
jgi:hypothetical protein